MKERAPSTTGFEHDRPYMKLDIWEPGEIENLFGHDPATYPNQDLLQHYPTIQFNPGVDTSNAAAIDSNLNVHSMPSQKAAQTSRPGFQNIPSDLHSFNSTLPVSKANSNDEGNKYAEVNSLPVIEKVEDKLADPATKAVTVKPGFQNVATDVVDGPAKLPVSKAHSSTEGVAHAEDNKIPVRDGYKPLDGATQPTTTTPKPTTDTAKPTECDPNGADGTLCDTEARGDSAAAAVDTLLKTEKEKAQTTEDLAREAAALEEALKKSEEPTG